MLGGSFVTAETSRLFLISFAEKRAIPSLQHHYILSGICLHRASSDAFPDTLMSVDALQQGSRPSCYFVVK